MNYEDIQAQMAIKCKEAKEKWLEERCEKIEQLQKNNNCKMIHEEIKEVTGRKRIYQSTRGLKAKNGETLTEMTDIIQRWSEYMKDLNDDKDRDGDFYVNDAPAGPEILKEEVEHAMKRIKKINQQAQIRSQ